MLPFIITMSVLFVALIALGFYSYLRKGVAPTTFIRSCLTRVLTIFAVVFVLIGLRAPFHADSIKQVNWLFVVANIALGVLLGFCAAYANPGE